MEKEAEDPIDNILEKIGELRGIIKDNEEAINILDYIEDILRNSELLATASVRKLSKERSRRELKHIVDNMKRDKDVKRFIEVARYPWGTSRTTQLLMQVLWVIAAAISFMMGVYLFFPPYTFFGRIHGNATTTIQKTLELISKNPQVLSAMDPLFKIIGFVMMTIAVISLYQAHLISTYLKEE